MHPMDDNMEMEPSDISDTLDVTSEAEPTDNAVDADSSNAGETEKDTLSIVRDVVDDARESDEGSASPAESEETVADAADAPKEQDESYSDVPFHKHPRFKQLLQERDSYKGDAQRYQNVQTFLDTNGISAQEAADGFDIMAKLKTDPLSAWEKLRPVVQNLLVAIGEVLPEDLQGRVQNGQLTPDAAFEISRARAKANSVETRQSFYEQQSERRQKEAHERSLYDAAVRWESDRRLKDPNFATKFDALQKELVFIHHREGKATTPEGVEDQLKRAYAAVTVSAPAPAPQPKPKVGTSRLPIGASSSTNSAPKPNSTLDIIRAERAKRTG